MLRQLMWPSSVFALMLGISGCTGPRMAYQKVDGASVSSEQMELDTTICQGEKTKAKMAGYDNGSLGSAIGREMQSHDVEKGCMAQHGYIMRWASPS